MATAEFPQLSPLRCSPHIQSLLHRLHEQSLSQQKGLDPNIWRPTQKRIATDPTATAEAFDEIMLDKFVALDEDKCHFIYHLLLANGATTVVEAGTSFGVSTIYLALAVGHNVARGGNGKGDVIGTEKEMSKASIARQHWKEAGSEVERWIRLRTGDLNETLTGDMGLEDGQCVDMLLLDIWSHVALPALNLVLPKLRPGAVVITDNVISSAEGYEALLKVLRDPRGPFQSVTLPFEGGLEMSVYDPQKGEGDASHHS